MKVQKTGKSIFIRSIEVGLEENGWDLMVTHGTGKLSKACFFSFLGISVPSFLPFRRLKICDLLLMTFRGISGTDAGKKAGEDHRGLPASVVFLKCQGAVFWESPQPSSWEAYIEIPQLHISGDGMCIPWHT